MKRALMTAIVILTTAILVHAEQTPQVLAKDTTGVVVQVKEKYGTHLTDTCTVVMLVKNQFVLVHREGVSSWYPTSFHSVKIVRKLSAEKRESAATDQPLAMAQ